MARTFEVALPGELFRFQGGEGLVQGLGSLDLRPAPGTGGLPAAGLTEVTIPLALPATDPDASRALSGAPDTPVDTEDPLDVLVEQGPDAPPPPPPGTPDPGASPGASPTPTPPDERCPCEGPHAEPYAPNDEGLCFTHRNGCGGNACACPGNSLASAEFMHGGSLVDQGGGRFLCQKHAAAGCP